MKATETSEKVFERTLSKYVNDKGGIAVKLLSQFVNGLPDRLYLIPGGHALFIEFKSTGKKPTKIQEHIIDRIRKVGFTVMVVDSPETYKNAVLYIDKLLGVNIELTDITNVNVLTKSLVAREVSVSLKCQKEITT